MQETSDTKAAYPLVFPGLRCGQTHTQILGRPRKLHEGTISGAKLNAYTALTRFAADSWQQDSIIEKRIELAIEPASIE